jgi:hypothetical protein
VCTIIRLGLQSNTKKTNYLLYNIADILSWKKIELEFDSNLTSTELILEKVSQVVKYSKDQGLNLRELESEGDGQEKKDDD